MVCVITMETLQKEHIAVGRKQTVKAVKAGRAARVFLASDADSFIRDEILELCAQNGVPVDESQDMLSLGRACGIEVQAATVAVTK